MTPQKAITVAKYFLSVPDVDSGDLISNLKLQKLLYYAQGFAVAMHGEDSPLFRDKIYAWKHGPVVRSVYHHYSDAQSGALPIEAMPDALNQDKIEFLNEIYRVFGKFSAWKLRNMTHEEMPWKKNYTPNKKDVEIPLSDLQEYFSEYA